MPEIVEVNLADRAYPMRPSWPYTNDMDALQQQPNVIDAIQPPKPASTQSQHQHKHQQHQHQQQQQKSTLNASVDLPAVIIATKSQNDCNSTASSPITSQLMADVSNSNSSSSSSIGSIGGTIGANHSSMVVLLSSQNNNYESTSHVSLSELWETTRYWDIMKSFANSLSK